MACWARWGGEQALQQRRGVKGLDLPSDASQFPLAYAAPGLSRPSLSPVRRRNGQMGESALVPKQEPPGHGVTNGSKGGVHFRMVQYGLSF